MRTAALLALAAAAPAFAQTVPFVETFNNGGSGWQESTRTPVAWVRSGGPDGSAFITEAVNPDLLTTDQGSVIFRAEAANGASGNAFVGDWLGAGVTTVTFDVRHTALAPLDFYVRIAGASNFPGVNFGSVDLVPAGEWTTVSIDISMSNPEFQPEGPASLFDAVLAAVGNIQIAAGLPADYAGADPVYIDVDNFRVIPAPGALAVAGVGLLGAGRRRRR